MALLEVEDLSVRFETHHGTVQAVDGVSFTVSEGETLGLVGESGSGKSVTNLALLGLIPSPPGVVEAGSIRLDGKELSNLKERQWRRVRGKDIAMIFQDPMTSLNPLLTVGKQLVEMLTVHRLARGRAARRRCIEGLAEVGIPSPDLRMEQYPHELSGGMRQRVMIAMALLCEPRVLLADEPTTALDVTIQAQILDVMRDLQKRHGTAIVLVTHDLGVVAGMSDRVNVMYAGRLVETAGTMELFKRPYHPYTRGLLASVPRLGGDPHAALFSIPGQPPDLAALPAGCAFETRCEHASQLCGQSVPPLGRHLDTELRTPRRAACAELASLVYDYVQAAGESDVTHFIDIGAQFAGSQPARPMIRTSSGATIGSLADATVLPPRGEGVGLAPPAPEQDAAFLFDPSAEASDKSPDPLPEGESAEGEPS